MVKFLKSKLSAVLMVVLLSAIGLSLAGCGKESLDDEFIFGKNRVHCENSTITLSTPFEIISEGKQVDLVGRGEEKVSAEGHNEHLQILVTGNQVSSDENEEKLVKEAPAILQNNPSVSRLKVENKTFSLGDTKTNVLNFTFAETDKSRTTDLSVREYIFTYQGVVWRVIYQYRTGDATGKALADRVEGKISMGTSF